VLHSAIAYAQSATIISDTALYQSPRVTSSKIAASITAGTPVTIHSRLGGWKKISDVNGSEGWVRSYKVRSGAIVITEKEQNSNGFFSGLANLSRKASGLFSSEKKDYSFQRTATIGVRGLSEEQIKNAKPDMKQLNKMESYSSNKKSAHHYARIGQLQAHTISHLPKSRSEK
jgi:hypothetical protein